MNQKYFHFTLGPVQSLGSQARRTRDFWAGSFLLSWLVAVAIKSLKQQNGDIIFPVVNENYLGWISGLKNGSPPQQGCIPNRFKGSLAKVPEDFKPALIVESINQAWQHLADIIWENDLKHCPEFSKAIWQRQVENFWEISWVLTSGEESNLLDQRKNWRSYMPPDQAGVKCMVMDGWQELSGTERPSAEALNAFWQPIRDQGKHGIKTDLEEGEYLCAIAFIKRRFAHYFQEVNKTMPGDWQLTGWSVNISVPSVSYIAATPWLAQVLEQAPKEKLAAFHELAKDLTANNYAESQSKLKCIQSVIDAQADQDKLLFCRFTSLDGNVFFESALDNKNIFEDQNAAKEVKKALKQIQQSSENIEAVSPFYAVLLMDGDSLGKHMSDKDKQKHISDALNQFTNSVADIVKANSGFLVYAGGDDVLALLPLEYALTCANQLRLRYLKCFENTTITSTLSGAIEFAHIKMPLGKVLRDAHHLLDDIAKEQTGRDAVAVRVWKPGGQHLQWAMPWQYVTSKENKEQIELNVLVDQFREDKQTTPFSNSFFFNVEQRLAVLTDKNHNSLLSTDELSDLIATEYLHSGVNQVAKENKITLPQATERIKPLLDQCAVLCRKLVNEEVVFEKTQPLNFDALQLIRFFVQKGVDHG